MGTKEVTYKHLTVGQEVKGVRGEGRYQGFTGYVDEINPAFVTVAMWRIDGRKEQYSTASKPHVALRSSARDNRLFKPYQNGSKTPENQGFPGFSYTHRV